LPNQITIAIMAGASDKARFYLEQSVPELREFERKKVFTKVSVLLRLITISRANFNT
jgi:U3 small nucleolar RNA-associated protein 6